MRYRSNVTSYICASNVTNLLQVTFINCHCLIVTFTLQTSFVKIHLRCVASLLALDMCTNTFFVSKKHRLYLTGKQFLLAVDVVKKVKIKVKAFPYLIPSVGPGADPGAQAVSPQVTVSHPSSGRLRLVSARPVVTSPVPEHHCPLASCPCSPMVKPHWRHVQ